MNRAYSSNVKRVLSMPMRGKEHEKLETKADALADQITFLSFSRKQKHATSDTP